MEGELAAVKVFGKEYIGKEIRRYDLKSKDAPREIVHLISEFISTFEDHPSPENTYAYVIRDVDGDVDVLLCCEHFEEDDAVSLARIAAFMFRGERILEKFMVVVGSYIDLLDGVWEKIIIRFSGEEWEEE